MMDQREKEIKLFEERMRKRYAKKTRIVRLIVQPLLILLYGILFAFRTLYSLLYLVILGTPTYLVLIFRYTIKGIPVFTREVILGRHGKRLPIIYFNVRPFAVRTIPLYWFVIINKMNITGVSIRPYSENERILGDAYVLSTAPGIFNLWFIRESSRTGHEGQAKTDWEYLTASRGIVGDFLLILKTIPALLYHQETGSVEDKLCLLGVEFENQTMHYAIDLIQQTVEENGKRRVFFVNPDCFNKLTHDRDYRIVLNRAETIFPDGIGINIACKIMNQQLRENVNGTDMFPFICEMASQKGMSLYFLGAKPGVVDALVDNLKGLYPALHIAGYHHGYFDKEKESEEIVERINASSADILFVAFGAPYQEKWIDYWYDQINTKVLLGVGGLFDFYSGRITRSPRWMREIGLEWLYRLYQEPGRMWRRYIIGNPLFLIRVLKWKSREG